MFLTIFVIALICSIVGIILSFFCFYDCDDEHGWCALIIGVICLVIVVVMGVFSHVDDTYFYGDEYDIQAIKTDLDEKGITGKTKTISAQKREYVQTFTSRFDNKTYYYYAIHDGGVQLEKYEQYKKVE